MYFTTLIKKPRGLHVGSATWQAEVFISPGTRAERQKLSGGLRDQSEDNSTVVQPQAPWVLHQQAMGSLHTLQLLSSPSFMAMQFNTVM